MNREITYNGNLLLVGCLPAGTISAASIGVTPDFIEDFWIGSARYKQLSAEHARVVHRDPRSVVEVARQAAAALLADGKEAPPVPTVEQATHQRASELEILDKARAQVVAPLLNAMLRASVLLSVELQRLAQQREAVAAAEWAKWEGSLHQSGFGCNDSGDLVPPLCRAWRQTSEYLARVREGVERGVNAGSWSSPEDFLQRLLLMSPSELEAMVAEPPEQRTILQKIAGALF
jgi:hypothetical protein